MAAQRAARRGFRLVLDEGTVSEGRQSCQACVKRTDPDSVPGDRTLQHPLARSPHEKGLTRSSPDAVTEDCSAHNPKVAGSNPAPATIAVTRAQVLYLGFRRRVDLAVASSDAAGTKPFSRHVRNISGTSLPTSDPACWAHQRTAAVSGVRSMVVTHSSNIAIASRSPRYSLKR